MDSTDGGIGRLGIVGAAAEKFTPATEAAARREIREALSRHRPSLVISGASPMGGVDWWAIEEAQRAGISCMEYPPAVHSWLGRGGFRDRNLQIAAASDLVLCIVVKELPPNFKGMRFAACYHCAGKKEAPGPHIKSGGCWTAWQCKAREWRVI